jgi:hypothetical protein
MLGGAPRLRQEGITLRVQRGGDGRVALGSRALIRCRTYVARICRSGSYLMASGGGTRRIQRRSSRDARRDRHYIRRRIQRGWHVGDPPRNVRDPMAGSRTVAKGPTGVAALVDLGR